MLKIFRKFKVIGYMHNKNNSLTKCFSYKFSISNNISENDGNDDSGESFTGSSACKLYITNYFTKIINLKIKNSKKSI